MTVRIRVAKSESIPWIPIFAKIAVSAAKQADNAAQKNQLLSVVSICFEYTGLSFAILISAKAARQEKGRPFRAYIREQGEWNI
jgi:hypothetical protein